MFNVLSIIPLSYCVCNQIFHSDSSSFDVSPGDVLHGTVTLDRTRNAYRVEQHDETTGQKVSGESERCVFCFGYACHLYT
jgi:hypothetical protein